MAFAGDGGAVLAFLCWTGDDVGVEGPLKDARRLLIVVLQDKKFA